MIRQTRAQAEQSFEQWLRERRQEAYAALLSACDAVHDALNTVIGHTLTTDRPPLDERRQVWRLVNQGLKSVDRAARTAAVVGPADVTEKAAAMQEALYGVVHVWRQVPEPPADQRVVQHADANRAWEEAAALYVATVQQVTQTFRAD
ncbi:hypothetical protein ACIBAI_22560 [Streptomyces sp. NPDC051041]|uniref:hypothetical protein n=1 Tax=Streptomyces sp. NPDC051041 TaxID=3365640 RepID=UPI0037A8930A